MTREKIKKILELHQKWLNGELDGVKADLAHVDLAHADLSYTNLSYADLSYADLRGVDLRKTILRGTILTKANLVNADLSDTDLSGANLNSANLYKADLNGAKLFYADLTEANLSYADLINADLNSANLYKTDLYKADLIGANLVNADLSEAKNVPFLPQCEICPSDGAFIGWKKVNGYIIKLQIPEDAKRSSATSRKCRCSKALVLAIQKKDSRDSGLTEIVNYNYAPSVKYKVGEMVYPDSFDEDRWNECSNGIHFFITRQEAVDY